MPGGKGNVESPHWFKNTFGFDEGSYDHARQRFEMEGDELVSKVNGARFHVGPFETPTLEELRQRWRGSPAQGGSGGLAFQNVTGNARSLHQDPQNAGAAFQVASQFNCLEMNEPGARPEDGVTRYYNDKTQGPSCALSCPAGTVYRNYFVNGGRGQGHGNQIDCLRDAGSLLQNGREHYWKMVNGYCMPQSLDSIGRLSKVIGADPALPDALRSQIRVGIHWDTAVKGCRHRVCQVFCSALPVAYAKSTRSADWAPFATIVLEAVYEATLTAAAVLAAQSGSDRLRVYLTAVGGGAFGNRSMWITQALEHALSACTDMPLDVRLVHFGTVPRSAYSGLERNRRKPAALKAVSAPAAADDAPGEACAQEEDEPEAPAQPDMVRSISDAERITAVFAEFDANEDGIIDRSDIVKVLKSLSPTFTEQSIDAIIEEADADADGQVHYAELVAWLCSEDSGVTSRVLTVARTSNIDVSDISDAIGDVLDVEGDAPADVAPEEQSAREPDGFAPTPSSAEASVQSPGGPHPNSRGCGSRGRGSMPAVLKRIRDAQDKNNSFSRTLREISAGKKRSHTIWFIWPTVAALRPGTSRPEFLLPDLHTAQAYLQDSVLLGRFAEVTTAATKHLSRGTAPQVLFGSSTDADKFAESVTIFAVAATESGDEEALRCCAEALTACQKGKLNARAMDVVVGTYGLSQYRDVHSVAALGRLRRAPDAAAGGT